MFCVVGYAVYHTATSADYVQVGGKLDSIKELSPSFYLLSYSYVVGGQTYRGSGNLLRPKAEPATNNPIDVYYFNNNPSVSYLKPPVNSNWFGLSLLLVSFLALAYKGLSSLIFKSIHETKPKESTLRPPVQKSTPSKYIPSQPVISREALSAKVTSGHGYYFLGNNGLDTLWYYWVGNLELKNSTSLPLKVIFAPYSYGHGRGVYSNLPIPESSSSFYDPTPLRGWEGDFDKEGWIPSGGTITHLNLRIPYFLIFSSFRQYFLLVDKGGNVSRAHLDIPASLPTSSTSLGNLPPALNRNEKLYVGSSWDFQSYFSSGKDSYPTAGASKGEDLPLSIPPIETLDGLHCEIRLSKVSASPELKNLESNPSGDVFAPFFMGAFNHPVVIIEGTIYNSSNHRLNIVWFDVFGLLPVGWVSSNFSGEPKGFKELLPNLAQNNLKLDNRLCKGETLPFCFGWKGFSANPPIALAVAVAATDPEGRLYYIQSQPLLPQT